MQKGFAPILIILSVVLLLGVVGGAYYLGTIKNSKPELVPTINPQGTVTPVKDETANWKVYSNTIRGIGFSFMYPQNLFYSEDQNFGPTFFDEADKNKDERTITSKFSVIVNDLGRDFDTLYKLPDNTIAPSEKAGIGEKVIKLKNIMLGNQKAVQYAISSPDRYILVTLTKMNNVFIEVEINTENGFKPISDQILATFKFLEQNQTQSSLTPADADSPASGVCPGPQSATVATITLNEDTPSPRCIKVSANQQLQVINSTNQTVTFTLGQNSLTIGPKQKLTITQTFGSYLAPGVHSAKTSLYGGGGPEIWLQ